MTTSTVRGSIERLGKPTIAGVLITLSEGMSGGLKFWAAECSLPLGERIEPGEPVRLVFEDGRAGDAFVKSWQPGPTTKFVEFAAAGELKGDT